MHTAKKAKYLFNRLYSFFEQKNNLDQIEEILFPKFVQSTLDNHIKTIRQTNKIIIN